MNSRSISGGVPTPQFLFIHAVKGWDVASNPHRACACGCIDCKKLGLVYFGLALVIEVLGLGT